MTSIKQDIVIRSPKIDIRLYFKDAYSFNWNYTRVNGEWIRWNSMGGNEKLRCLPGAFDLNLFEVYID